jgi:GDPmannose 4,6-dehydratase
VTKKITRGLARILAGKDDCLYLGNMDAKRDWGYAKDYVEGMWRMLQQNTPDDFVLATGETHSVREFIEESCKIAGIDLKWQGKGEKEVGIDKNTNKTIIKIDPRYYRPAEVEILLGDPSKAKKELGWTPTTTFKDLVKMMMEDDLKNEGVTK